MSLGWETLHGVVGIKWKAGFLKRYDVSDVLYFQDAMLCGMDGCSYVSYASILDVMNICGLGGVWRSTL